MTFDFGALPPEVNSTRMYTGPGAAPLMAAAAAWNNVAAELNTTASASQSVISTLTDDEWRGPSAVAMASAATPYVAWMQTTAGAAQLAADQAMASAAAYEAALAMTVPPPLVVANRVQLAALVASNVLGQNTPAIAVTEAQYGEMWAQDAAAMYGYAGSSASAGKLEPLTDPAPTTNAGGLSGQAAAVAQATGTSAGLPGLVSGLPTATQSLSGPLSGAAAPASALSDFFSNSLVENIPNGIFDMASWNGFNAIVTGILYAHTADAGLINNGLAPAFGGLGTADWWPQKEVPTAAVASAVGSPMVAGMGQASTVGKLSVPAAWSAATPAEPAAAAPLAGSGWTTPVEEGGRVSTVATGMPAYASAGRGGFAMGPRYGVKPTVMPKHLVV